MKMTIEEIEEIMEMAAIEHKEMKIISKRGITYEGEADGFTKADDEEDGYASVIIGNWCIGSNEVKSFEIL